MVVLLRDARGLDPEAGACCSVLLRSAAVEQLSPISGRPHEAPWIKGPPPSRGVAEQDKEAFASCSRCLGWDPFVQ